MQSTVNYRRIVIKVGASLFCAEKGGITHSQFQNIAAQVLRLVQGHKKEVIIVSSGAIALGMEFLGLKSRPRELAYLQAAAAIGQNCLMDNYSQAFFKVGKDSRLAQLKCAQVLLTWEDFSDRKRYLNAKSTLLTLLKLGVVPIINENDTISTQEIKFGDNDRLSALVATLVNADLLLVLSDVTGLMDKQGRLVQEVLEINAGIRQLACPSKKKACVGGMITKIEAAKIAVDSGIPCVIACGHDSQIIEKIVIPSAGQDKWTIFLPKKIRLGAKERWIAFGTKTKGNVIVDEGAKQALLNKKSLLSVGVTAVDGNFSVGDIISIRDIQGEEFARGKVRVASKQLQEVKGKRFEKEIIHRDNIVIL